MHIIHPEQITGVLYDYDDTLISNYPSHFPHGIHAESRVRALSFGAKELGVSALAGVTPAQSKAAFMEAREHSVEGGMWQILVNLGLIQDGPIQRDHELVIALSRQKRLAHEQLLREHVSEVAGATTFLTALGNLGLPQAIASGASHSEINIGIEKLGWQNVFPGRRIVAHGNYTYAKPHHEPFEKAFLTLGVDDTPENRQGTLAFEDDPKGIISAQAAGMGMVYALTTRFPAERFVDMGIPTDMIGRDFVHYAEVFGFSG